jgi:hypothetical protein
MNEATPQGTAMGINNSIDNLSTLRSSDVNEREKRLLEKVASYKKENSKLV